MREKSRVCQGMGVGEKSRVCQGVECGSECMGVRCGCGSEERR